MFVNITGEANLCGVVPFYGVPSILGIKVLSGCLIRGLPRTSITVDMVRAEESEMAMPGNVGLRRCTGLCFSTHGPVVCGQQRRSVYMLGISPEVLSLRGMMVTSEGTSDSCINFRRPLVVLSELSCPVVCTGS